MPGWEAAVQEGKDAIRLLVEVTAGSKQARFPDGFNAWREGRIGVRVRAPAQEGKANAEVIATVAAFFGVPSPAVVVAAGATDSRKSLEVRGVEAHEARRLLAAAFARS